MNRKNRLGPLRDFCLDLRRIEIEVAFLDVERTPVLAPSRAITPAVAKKREGLVMTSSSRIDARRHQCDR